VYVPVVNDIPSLFVKNYQVEHIIIFVMYIIDHMSCNNAIKYSYLYKTPPNSFYQSKGKYAQQNNIHYTGENDWCLADQDGQYRNKVYRYNLDLSIFMHQVIKY